VKYNEMAQNRLHFYGCGSYRFSFIQLFK
jgi:hypothetical protein